MKETLVQWLIEKFKDLEVDFKYSVIDYETYKSKQIDLLEEAKQIEIKNMCNFAEFVSTYPDKNKNQKGELLHAKSKYDGAERTIDLLEKYYAEKR